jgi:hypothetical protein
MLLRKKKAKNPNSKEEDSTIPQSIPVVDTKSITKKLEDAQAKEKRERETRRETRREREREREHCCWGSGCCWR